MRYIFSSRLFIASIFFAFFTCMSGVLFAQHYSPVKWTFSAKKSPNKKGEYIITYSAKVDKKWHVYSQHPGEGPVATKIVVDKNPILRVGEAREKGQLIEHFDSGFGRKLKYYENALTLEQNVILRSPVKTRIKGYVEYMACDDSKCLPPARANFEIPLN